MRQAGDVSPTYPIAAYRVVVGGVGSPWSVALAWSHKEFGMPGMPRTVSRVFSRMSWPEARRIAEILRKETIGGLLLLVAAGCALLWANSPWAASYQNLREVTVGPASLQLNLTLQQ